MHAAASVAPRACHVCRPGSRPVRPDSRVDAVRAPIRGVRRSDDGVRLGSSRSPVRPVRAGEGAVSEASTEYTSVDAERMRRALELAATATGKTFPNPVVGCVIVDDDGVVVGEGYHPKAGEPHAEVFALRAAGDAARGATAYVTLEPCDHFGRTPPCSRALVDAGVRRVVVGFVDPDPRVSGGGIRTLLSAGVEVAVGCEEEACRAINADFIARNT